MVAARDRAERSIYDKSRDCESDRFTKDSLEGKWLKLARDWIEINSPCTVSDFMRAVTPLMPTHINRARLTKDPQFALARWSISHLCNKGVIKKEDGFLVAVDRKKVHGYGWRKLIGDNETVEMDFYAKREDRKKWGALDKWLRTNGFKRISANAYAKQSCQSTPT